MDWKGIWEKVLAGVIGATILGLGSWFWGSWSAPEAPAIVSIYNAMDVPNPIPFERDPKKLADFDAAVRLPGLAKYLSGADSTFRLGTLKVKNSSRIRSKAIELSMSSGGVLRFDDGISGREFQKQTTIQSLDGMKEARFIVVSHSHLFSQGVPVQLIYDNRTLDVGSFPDLESAAFFAGGTPFALFFAGVGLIAVIFLVVGGVFAVVAKMNPDLEIKNMTNAQVAKMLKQLERIKEKFPEKLPKDGTPPVAN